MKPAIRCGLRASTSPISSSSTASAGRPSSVQHPGPLASGHLVDRADRRAALREPGDQRHLGAQQHARDPALGRPAGDLQQRAARPTLRPPTRNASLAVAQAGDRVRRAGVARVAVDHAERRPRPDLPPSAGRAQRRADRGLAVELQVEQAEAALRQARDQRHDRAAARRPPDRCCRPRRRRCRPSRGSRSPRAAAPRSGRARRRQRSLA